MAERISLGPFTAGINRLVDRALLSQNELYDCLGINIERGRVHHCWEKELLTYAGVSTGAFPSGVRPLDIDFWPSFGSRYWGLLVNDPETRLLNYKIETAPPFGAGKDPYGLPLDGLLGHPAADTIVYRGVLFVFEPNLPAKAFIPLTQDSFTRMRDGIGSNTRTTDNFDTNNALGTDAVLGLAIDPSYQLSNVSNLLAGFPIYLARRYIEYSATGESNSLTWRTNSSDPGVGSSAPAGPDTWIRFQTGPYLTAPYNYDSFDEARDAGGTVSFAYFSNSDAFDPNNMDHGSFFCDLPLSGPDDLSAAGDALMHTDSIPDHWNSIRVPVAGSWLMYKSPAIYKDRLVVVDSAEFNNLGLSAGFKQFNDLSGTPVDDPEGLYIDLDVGTDLTTTYDVTITRASNPAFSTDVSWAAENLDVGDRLIVQAASGPPSTRAYTDPTLFDHINGTSGDNVILEVVGFQAQTKSQPVVRRLDSGVFGFSGPDHHFWLLKKNTSQNRRFVPLGRPSGTIALNSNAPGFTGDANIFDWMIEDSTGQIVFSVEEEGEIVALAALEGSIVVFLENAIRVIEGDLPLGNAIPPNFRTDVISTRLGLTSKRAFVIDDESQTIYFAAKDGLYRLYGRNIERIDSKIRYAFGRYENPFTRVVKQDKWLFFVNENQSVPSIWILDLTTETWWRDERSGGLSLSVGQTAALMAPFDDDSGIEEKIFFGARESLYTYNDLEEIPAFPTQNSTVPHKCYVQTGFTESGDSGTIWPRRVSVRTSKNETGNSPRCALSVVGEGFQTIGRLKDPLNRKNKDILKYRLNANSRSVGAESLSVVAFDPGLQPVGEVPGSIDRITIDIEPSGRDY